MAGEKYKPTKTDAGIPVESDEYSLTVGPGGPVLLQESYPATGSPRASGEAAFSRGIERRNLA